MCEIWKDIEGYNGLYKISNTGRIIAYSRQREGYSYKAKRKTTRIYKEKELKITKGERYYFIILMKNGKYRTELLHRLIAKAFISNPYNKPNINHIDFNTFNNSISNLEWCTQYENIHHTMNNGRNKQLKGSECGKSKFNDIQVFEIRNMKKQGISEKEISEKYKVSKSCINRIINFKAYK